MISKKVSVSPRWSGPIPTRKDGTPLPKNQWARAGRNRAWEVRWFDLDGKRPSKAFRSREDAEAFALTKTVEFEVGGPAARVSVQRRTVERFCIEFEKLRTGPRGQRLSAGTLREYLRVLREFAAFTGADTMLESISRSDVARFFLTMRDRESRNGGTLSAHSINKAKRSLKTVLNVAVEQLGYLKRNPCDRQRQDKVADTANRYVTPQEFTALIGACRDYFEPHKRLWWEAFVSLCYTSGTRANEAVHLTWADVDFDDSSIRIIAKPDSDHTIAWRPKDIESRSVPIPEATVTLLARMQSEAASGSAYVFVSVARITQALDLKSRGLWKEDRALVNLHPSVRCIVKAAGVSRLSLHDLRRSCLTHWARRLPIHVVQELAGHASMETTRQFYLSVQESDRELARQAIADIMTQTGA